MAGLEYSTDRTAEVVGKPSKTFFQLAAGRFPGDIPHTEILMIGDDVRDDVLGLFPLVLVRQLLDLNCSMLQGHRMQDF